MLTLLHRFRCRCLFILVLILCLLPPVSGAEHLKKEQPFSVLILGDSQMAGDGWDGGYANCIQEAYPNAQVYNLAKSGSLLANGDVHAQLEVFLSDGCVIPDFVLLDGGINDLSYMKEEMLHAEAFALVNEALCSLIEQIHAINPDTHIIYTLMPPLEEWKDSDKGPPSYDIQERYWRKLNIIASDYDYVTVLDLFSLNPFCFPCAECYQLYFADSIHLNEAGYRRSFEYIDQILVAKLAQKLGQ